MHIAIDGRVIAPRFPGIGRATYQLALALADARSHDRLTLVVTPGQDGGRHDLPLLERRPNISLLPVAAPVGSCAAHWRLPAALGALRPDVWHATYWLTTPAGQAPMVLSVYDLIGLRVPGSLPRGRSTVLRLVLRVAVRRARLIVTLSEWSRRDLVRAFGLAPERVVVTPLAADERFRPRAAAEHDTLRQRLGLPQRYVLYVGINKPHKNLTMLVEAWIDLNRQWPEAVAANGDRVELVLAGPWDGRYPQARDLAAAHRDVPIRFLGPVAEADLPALYSAALVFAYPSRHEGFGLPPLEAMACGTAVMAADATSLPEVVGTAGLLLPPDDRAAWSRGLAYLLRDDAERARIAAAGVVRARAFTWAETAARTRQAYARAAARR